MKLNLTKMMMMMMILLSMMMMMSSNNIMFSWMSMEINLISFMPLMTKKKKMKDQPMKYFIVQSLSSSMMLMSVLVNSMIESPINLSTMLMMSMLMKMGMMPFHLWMPNLMKKMSWNNCIMMSTIQKVPTTILTSQLTTMKMMIMPMILSMMMAPISAIKMLSMKKIFSYSSIANSPVMITSMKMSKSMFMMFMLSYSMIILTTMKLTKDMNVQFINQMMNESKKKKMELTISMLSMSGMPPMTGFFMKWMILQKMSEMSILLSTSMILSSILSTFIYMKMISPMMMMSMSTKKTKNKKSKKKITSNNILINILGSPMIMMFKPN